MKTEKMLTGPEEETADFFCFLSLLFVQLSVLSQYAEGIPHPRHKHNPLCPPFLAANVIVFVFHNDSKCGVQSRSYPENVQLLQA